MRSLKFPPVASSRLRCDVSSSTRRFSRVSPEMTVTVFPDLPWRSMRSRRVSMPRCYHRAMPDETDTRFSPSLPVRNRAGAQA